eukprot:TRINITY_DN6464_c0_g2_i2.p2 TRINITY_DN6464_c0_g2~~TRINITY_DN6464_c0_g2_i2.p2  ORF type:complete len:106 (+),score=19.92 TRINITY_DN6464_c0_g2_i2:44-361(+)
MTWDSDLGKKLRQQPWSSFQLEGSQSISNDDPGSKKGSAGPTGSDSAASCATGDVQKIMHDLGKIAATRGAKQEKKQEKVVRSREIPAEVVARLAGLVKPEREKV